MKLLTNGKLWLALLLYVSGFLCGTLFYVKYVATPCPVCPPTVSNVITIDKIKSRGMGTVEFIPSLDGTVIQHPDTTAKPLTRKEKRQLRRQNKSK